MRHQVAYTRIHPIVRLNESIIKGLTRHHSHHHLQFVYITIYSCIIRNYISIAILSSFAVALEVGT
jgi:hypothetical protein